MTIAALESILPLLPAGICGVQSTALVPTEPFVAMARRFAHLPGTVALISGGTLYCARYNILGIHPWLTLKAGATDTTLKWDDQTMSIGLDPLTAMQNILKHYALTNTHCKHPIISGLLGYLSYDLKDCLEVLPRTSIDDLGLPHLYMVAHQVLVVQDRVDGTTTAHLPIFDNAENEVHQRFAAFHEQLAAEPRTNDTAEVVATRPVSSFSRPEYLSAVAAIRDYIAQGDVYQVNMSQRFQSQFLGDPYALFSNLFEQNPAPFFAYINAGDHQILSTSPERFLLLQGREVETRPIKGTRPRRSEPAADTASRLELLNSTKDAAELSMIVDLMRNDIGKVCRAGSVRVSEHKRLEAYQNVYHLVSNVHGVLDDGQDAVDLIRATFPGGSITGCPKIRSMEVIDELEPVRRHIYTGSIGYLSFHETMDLSIAIRTATVHAGKLVFSVGGGVVYDSDPNCEFEETLHKGRTLMDALNVPATQQRLDVQFAWCNGFIKPVDKISISIKDEGFNYGYGFFETIRVQNGRPHLLEEHLERFECAWRYCFGTRIPDVTWRDVISQLVEKNRLMNRTAAVKILATAGTPSSSACAENLFVTAREYTSRLQGSSRHGLDLVVYPYPRYSNLADFKTMNYMSCRLAARWAKEHAADESIILNPDQTVSETNTANLLCVISGNVYRPYSDHVLPGIMEKAVCRLLTSWGRSVDSRPLSVGELKNAEAVFLTNSLMGAISVDKIDGQLIASCEDLCHRINEALQS